MFCVNPTFLRDTFALVNLHVDSPRANKFTSNDLSYSTTLQQTSTDFGSQTIKSHSIIGTPKHSVRFLY